MRTTILRILVFCVLSLFLNEIIYTQDEPGRVTKTIALENVHVVTRPGTIIKNANVVIKNGLITNVGKGIRIPLDAEKIKADTMYVYAGFIDGLSHIGVPKPQMDGDRPKPKDPGNPTNERAGVTPDRLVSEYLSPKDVSIAGYRKVGYTAAHVVPHGRMLPGQGAIILLDGAKSEDMIYRDGFSHFGQLEGAGGVYPNTVIGVMTKYRELYRQAGQASTHIAKYKSSAVGMNRPKYDEATLAMVPLTKGQSILYMNAPDHLDIHRVMQLQRDLGFKMVLTGLKKGYRTVDKIKAKRIPVLLSMDLPKEIKKEEKKKDEKEKESQWDKRVKAFKIRKAEAINQAVMQAATFEERGIPFGFTTMETSASKVLPNVRRMIKSGLSEKAALSALTTHPAQILGISQSMGTIESGKIANMVISNGPIFHEKSKIAYVFVDGVMHKYDIKKATKKKGSGKVSDKNKAFVGTWEFKVDAGGEEVEGELEIKEEEGKLIGVLTGAGLNETVEVEEIMEKDSTISFSATGDGTKIMWTAKIENDGMNGSVTVDGEGPFTIIATRTSSPE